MNVKWLISIITILAIFLAVMVGIKVYKNVNILPAPPKIQYQLSKHKKGFLREIFKSCNWTGYKSELVQACDYSNSIVRNYSVKLAGTSPGEFNIGQICDVFDHYHKNWKYVNDPPRLEYVAKASETIANNFNGDCDDFAVLMCSSIISIGGEARLNFASNQESGHAFVEVNVGQTNIDPIANYLTMRYLINENIWYRTDKKGNNWLNLDWFAQHPGGKYFDYTRGTSFYILQNYCQDFVNN